MIKSSTLYPQLIETIHQLNTEFISSERKQILQPLVTYIQSKVDAQEEIRLNFICTHNSRRSHLSQIWAQVMSHHFGVHRTFCYSGGTEATAMYPMIVETLINSGLEINPLSEGANPVYAVKYSSNQHPIVCFSKAYHHTFNAQSDYAAIMTCNHADQGCPVVMGAATRIPITFEDPKAFDDSPLKAEKYLERSTQIATELFYVFSQVELKHV